jgi:hypothetical protein
MGARLFDVRKGYEIPTLLIQLDGQHIRAGLFHSESKEAARRPDFDDTLSVKVNPTEIIANGLPQVPIAASRADAGQIHDVVKMTILERGQSRHLDTPLIAALPNFPNLLTPSPCRHFPEVTPDAIAGVTFKV